MVLIRQSVKRGIIAPLTCQEGCLGMSLDRPTNRNKVMQRELTRSDIDRNWNSTTCSIRYIKTRVFLPSAIVDKSLS